MNILRLGIAIGVCLAVGVIGSIFTYPSVNSWYQFLQKPPLTPPGFVFGPVWTILYVLMGISLYLVWGKRFSPDVKRKALVVFGIQLGLNLLWSILFFGFQMPLFAFIEIIVLWIAIFYTIVLFRKIYPWASYLLIPYLLWVSFASYLNLGIVVLS